MVKKKAVIPFYFFSDRNGAAMACNACMGGVFREKNFFNLIIYFGLSFTILKSFFDFGLRKLLPLNSGKNKKRVPYSPRLPLNILNQSLKSSFFPLSINIKNVLLNIPTTYINPKAVAHAPTADPIACNPKPKISILITQLSYIHASNKPLISNAFAAYSILTPAFPND